MPYCEMCGVVVPKGQRFCSMCYGDPFYGHDGYYQDMLEREARQQQDKQEWERLMDEQMCEQREQS